MTWQILQGHVLERLACLPDASVQAVITSPPYFGLRAYAGDQAVDWPEVEFYPMAGLESYMAPVRVPAQRVAFGAESDPLAYVGHTVAICRELRRVLRKDGLLWWNVGDSYNSSPSNQQSGGVQRDGYNQGYDLIGRQQRNIACLKPKDKIAIPERVALALQADGWYYRQDVIWHKRAPMPESVQDRCTKAHEYVFMLAKSPRYFYDALAVAEESADPDDNRKARQKPADRAAMVNGDGDLVRAVINPANPTTYPTRNKRSVWTLSPQPFPGAHFATWPPALVEPMILASTSARGCCPACGASWVRVVERSHADNGVTWDDRKRAGEGGRRGYNRNYTNITDAGNTFASSLINTLGWRPSCTCDAGDPIPCVVLDPFNGSGTTGAVAVELGRDYIGIEIAAEYIALAEQRIGGAQPALLPVGV